MRNSECTASLNLQINDISLTADICPDFNLIGSKIALELENLKFNSSEVNLPNCYYVDEGKAVSVSGSGTLIIEEESKEMHAFFSLFLLDSDIGVENLAAIVLSTIDKNGAITSFSLIFVTDKLNLNVNSCDVQSQLNLKAAQFIQLGDTVSHGKMVIVKNGQINVKEI